MKILIGIALGYVLGVISIFIYQIFGKPSLPTEPKEKGAINFIQINPEDIEFVKLLIKAEYNRPLFEEYE